LIAASVWIAPEIENCVSEATARSTADTIPTESDCACPNGDPMAATGSPTWTFSLSPSGSGRSDRPFGSTFSSAMSAFGS
jgi:hypothetical protein